jgi:hypothetical protein
MAGIHKVGIADAGCSLAHLCWPNTILGHKSSRLGITGRAAGGGDGYVALDPGGDFRVHEGLGGQNWLRTETAGGEDRAIECGAGVSGPARVAERLKEMVEEDSRPAVFIAGDVFGAPGDESSGSVRLGRGGFYPEAGLRATAFTRLPPCRLA